MPQTANASTQPPEPAQAAPEARESVISSVELAKRLGQTPGRVRQLLAQGYLETRIIGRMHAVTWPLVWLKAKPRGYVHFGKEKKADRANED